MLQIKQRNGSGKAVTRGSVARDRPPRRGMRHFRWIDVLPLQPRIHGNPEAGPALAGSVELLGFHSLPIGGPAQAEAEGE